MTEGMREENLNFINNYIIGVNSGAHEWKAVPASY
jgi:hypothetical protein